MTPERDSFMRSKLLLVILLTFASLAPVVVQADGVPNSPRYIATYFYTNIRCPSCMTIERLTEKTITTGFKEKLDSGLMQWRTINIDGEGNFHYVKDYKLYTKSVIISEMADGKEVRWKNLPKVWELLGNEEEFRKYLTEEITSFMAGT